MMRFELFGKAGCAKCRSTRDKLTHLIEKAEVADEVFVTFVDMDTIEGMAEGAFNDVLDIPTTIARSDVGKPLARWDGRIPPAAEIQAYLARASV